MIRRKENIKISVESLKMEGLLTVGKIFIKKTDLLDFGEDLVLAQLEQFMPMLLDLWPMKRQGNIFIVKVIKIESI
jgi:hypothetical protein